jgi:hypothetical protein
MAVKLAIICLVLWWVIAELRSSWRDLSEYEWDLRPGWIVLSGIFYLFGLLPAGCFWFRVLRKLGQRPGLGETLRAYYIGHLGKYVPGKAMVVILRVGMLRGERVQTSVAAATVFLETLTMMATGAFVAAAILGLWFREAWLMMLIAIGLMVLAGLPTVPFVFRKMMHLAGIGRKDPELRQKMESLGFGTLFSGWLMMILVWIMLGLSLWATIRGIGVHDFALLEVLPLMIASVSLAMVAGFLSLLPGGLGVREFVLSELLPSWFATVSIPLAPEAAAFVAATLLRVVWLLSELILSGILMLPARGKLGRIRKVAEETETRPEKPLTGFEKS